MVPPWLILLPRVPRYCEHWPGVGDHTAAVAASQNVAVGFASQLSEPVGASF